MPIYEYRCESCGNAFEALVRGGVQPACPSCGATKAEKLLSVFATAGASADPAPAFAGGPCGGCGHPGGPGACHFQ